MSYWDYSNIGFLCDKKIVKQVRELLECIGVDFNEAQGSEAGEVNPMFWDAIEMGSDNSQLKLEEIYSIVNRVFDNVTIFFESEEGNSINDSYSRYEEIYDPKTNKVYIGERDYCYDGNRVFGESVYDLIREKCEEKANEEGVPIEWGDYYPEGEDFYNLCEEILVAEGGIEQLGTRKKTKDIVVVEIDKKIVNELIDCASKNGYNALVEKIKKAFETNYASKYIIENNRKTAKRKLSISEKIIVDNINRINKSIESMSISDLFWAVSVNQKVIDDLEIDDVIDLVYYERPNKEPKEFVKFCFGEAKLGLMYNVGRDIPAGIQGEGGLVYTWAVVQKNESGNMCLQYKYRFLDLDYELIRGEINALLGDEEKILVKEKYRTGDDKTDYITKNQVMNPGKEWFELIPRRYELHILDMAEKLGVEFLKYDRNI